MSVQDYLDKHMLSRRIEDAVNAAVKAKSPDPVLFISNHMRKAVPSVITKIKARQIFDSRGIPTVEVDLYTNKGMFRAASASGSSPGMYDALELRDGGNEKYMGKGISKAVKNINEKISEALVGMDPILQSQIDQAMIDLDKTENKSELDANAMLAVSIAVCKAGAAEKEIPLYEHIGDLAGKSNPVLPVPFITLISGGKHAGNYLAVQEIMILPIGANTFEEAMEMGSETYHHLKNVITEKYGSIGCNVGEDGGFALYYYLPTINGPNHSCVKLDRTLSIVVSFFRTIVDIFYFLHIAIKFRTAYIAPSSRVFGRGELVMNRSKIAKRYLSSEFFIELIAALPLPQIVIWIVMPVANNSNSDKNYHALSLVVFLQYIPRLYLIFPLSNKIIKATGVVMKTAWAGAAYNLLLYMLASHVLGASWYLLSIERLTTCWLNECKKDINCLPEYLNCEFLNGINRQNWENTTSVLRNCDVNFGNDSTISFNYGIFEGALSNNVVSINFIQKYFYCLWWGLQNLSSYGQNLATSTYIGETTFAIIIAIIGLVLFAHLIGNMQTYLQSVTIRLEEWRLKRRDTEEWMSHRQLPRELRERVRKFIQYKWLATRGVNEELILQSLPMDLRRDIQRHLCLDLVRRVPFFSKMDDQLLDAICERLVSSLSTEGTYIVREGDPVTEMYFIIRGKLESSTTNGGRTGFFNSINLRPGDFCGEELLAWALLPKSAVNLPSSTRTVLALVEVEAFALRAEDLKFVSNQFRRLHSKKLQHTFRFYSHHWRSWAACFVQAAWNRYKRRKLARDLINVQKGYPFKLEERTQVEDPSSSSFISDSSHPKHVTNYATKFSSYRRSPRSVATDDDIPKLQKPHEPDFSEDAYND